MGASVTALIAALRGALRGAVAPRGAGSRSPDARTLEGIVGARAFAEAVARGDLEEAERAAKAALDGGGRGGPGHVGGDVRPGRR